MSLPIEPTTGNSAKLPTRRQQHSHCSYCGAPAVPDAPWPRRCGACGETSFLNPIPVTIVLLPVLVAAAGGDTTGDLPQVGVLTVRRAIAPHLGKLALPGGYVDYGESWQAAGARELWEEAGVVLDPETLRPIEVFSAPDGTLIIAGIAPRLPFEELPPFIPNRESSERVVLLRPQNLAFCLHTELVARYLGGDSIGYATTNPYPCLD